MVTSLDLTGRILTHEELSKQTERGLSGKDNPSFFREDFTNHLLDKYKGTAVLYWKGILCGQGRNGAALLEEASAYYGRSNLTAFIVPEDEQDLDKAAFDLTGRLLTHEELSKQTERGLSGEDNPSFFREDFTNHLLDKYKGTAVLYWKGILCGQGRNGAALLEEASYYYGSSNLTVFNVPENKNGLDEAVSHAYLPTF